MSNVIGWSHRGTELRSSVPGVITEAQLPLLLLTPLLLPAGPAAHTLSLTRQIFTPRFGLHNLPEL